MGCSGSLAAGALRLLPSAVFMAIAPNGDVNVRKMNKISLDHIVYVVPDLEQACSDLESLTGIRPSPGGRHLALGTHNALLGLGDGRYLEVFAPDPERDEGREVVPIIGVTTQPQPRISTYCCDAGSMDAIDALASALDPGVYSTDVRSGSRTNEDDGTTVRWRVAVDQHSKEELPEGGLLPFVIAWDPESERTRPSATAVQGCRMLEFFGYHPDPDRMRGLLMDMGAEDVLSVRVGPRPRLVLRIQTPKGVVELS